MPGVTYTLIDFVTGRPSLDLPVKEGASWAAQLNRPDSVDCAIDMRDPDTQKLDLSSATTPMKSAIVARTDDDHVLAWGLIPDDGRSWDEDSQTLSLSASGVESSWLSKCPILPVSALTAALLVTDEEGYMVANAALDTTISGVSHGTIMKRLIQLRLAFPGAPTIFDFPPDEAGTRSESYPFASLKSIQSAISDLTRQDGGPDYAFDAVRAPNGLDFRYLFRHGSEVTPRLGSHVGIWALGEGSPISGLKVNDVSAAGASTGWATAGKQAGSALFSRIVNAEPLSVGYPPFDVVDTSHTDVSVQETLDSYNRENMRDAATDTRDVSFTVRGDAVPGIGAYRPGDTVTIDAGKRHPWLPEEFTVRITSIDGDETGENVSIGGVIVDA